MTAHETQDSVPSQDKTSPYSGPNSAWAVQQENFEALQIGAFLYAD